MFIKRILKKSQLFPQMSPERFNELLKAIRIIDFKPGDIILREGEPGTHFYIIKKGSVRIFKMGLPNEEIPLARLEKGAYFGEQAFLKETKNTRSASAKAITKVKLIEIPAEYLKEVLKKDTALKKQLRKRGGKQLLSRLTACLNRYNEILHLIKKNKNYRVVEFNDKQIIFSAGDIADFVYFILTGTVEVKLATKKSYDSGIRIISEGHIFGELAVLENKPRAGTTIAKGSVKALQIQANVFKKLYAQSPALKELLTAVRSSYQIPARGNVTQFVGKYLGADAISTSFKLNDGSTILATRILDTDIFSMQRMGIKKIKTLRYQDNLIDRELLLSQGKLIGVKTTGLWDELSSLCQMIFEKTYIDPAYQESFQKNGSLTEIQQTRLFKPDDLICECMSVPKRKLEELINEGAKSLEKLSEQTGACTVCRGCKPRIMELLGQSEWKSAVMSKVRDNNRFIRTYKIFPNLGKFKTAKPGQFIIIQAKTETDWAERSYTLSSSQDETKHYQVTIKLEPKGFFTRWLFEKARDSFLIKVSQPQGNFIFDPNNKMDVVCFAGGVGITPFLPFVQTFYKNNNKQKMHLVYSALTKDDFIFNKEFTEISKKMPNLTIEKWITDEKGLLQKENITQIVKKFNTPEIYICGPEGFVAVVKKALKSIHYDNKKIHLEQFVHAGGPVQDTSKK